MTSFAGTPEYLGFNFVFIIIYKKAPEILNNKPFDGKTAD